MDKKERADYIQKRLNALFPNPPIPLHHKDSYTLLIAVLLSARSSDNRVNEATPKLFALADNPWDMVKLSVPQIQEIIRPCGLSPGKSQAIHKLSKILIEKYNGEVPQDIDKLEELPGVGHKTASVVMTQAFNVPAFPIDIHIHRLAQMWELTEGRNVKKTEENLKKLFPRNSWSKLHLQIIYYGKEICPGRGCDGLRCSLCKECFPDRKKKLDIHKP